MISTRKLPALCLTAPALLGAVVWICLAAVAGNSTNYRQSVNAAGIEYLARIQDQYHDRFPVYDDVGSPGNHFHSLAKIPDESALVTSFGSSTLNPRSGATAIRCTFTPGGVNFGGFYYLNGVLPDGAAAPQPNFGVLPNAGVNLTGAAALSFWARGEQGGEFVEFFMGGIGRDPNTNAPIAPFPDSTEVVKQAFMLSTSWQQYSLDLTGKNLGYVLGGFGWIVDGAQNPGGAIFHIDDIEYVLSPARREARLNEPRLLRSFTTLPLQPNPNDANPDDDIDLVLRGAAFIYDNAVAALAFLAEGSADSLRRARLIADAFVYAAEHDRRFDDGRLRSVYSAGDIALPPGWTPNNRAGTAPVAGYYLETPQSFEFIELGESRTIDAGNNAWAMIALLAAHRRMQDVRYLNTARRIGDLLRTPDFRQGSGTYQGFTGGLEYGQVETLPPLKRTFAGSEHNIDIYAAFTSMFLATGETIWHTEAQHARAFVEAMWDGTRACYLAGTANPETRNTSPDQLPVDVQAWAVLALPDTIVIHPEVLACAENNHRLMHDAFSGFDFNSDRDGVWFEGTAQMATAYAWANQTVMAESLRQELQRAQQSQPYGDGQGISASCHDGVTTGFGFKLFRRLHVGATAWNVFAQSGFNPYYQSATPPGYGYEADVAPRPDGSNTGSVTLADWVQVGRYAVGLDPISPGSEFQRADCAPKATLGDGRITLADWVQAGLYAAGVDAPVRAGGPVAPQ
ncbi:MAG: hypothetical protein KF868_10405 [Acidobacteria bacterium]|nr:hypothetical protein [Acidobacteriota bacterium]